MQTSSSEGQFHGGTLRWVAGLSAVLLFAEPAWAAPAAQTTDDVIILLLQVFAIYAAILGVIVGLYYYGGHKAQKRAEASATWPTASGKVIASRVERRKAGKGGTSYEAFVRYDYAVAGARHECGMLQFGGMGQMTQALAEKELAPYPVGAAVTVHYDPASPGTATLDTSPAAGKARKKLAIWILIGGLLVYAILAVIILTAV